MRRDTRLCLLALSVLLLVLLVAGSAAASSATAVAAGSRHTCVLTSDGAVWCWGRNDSGALGDGTTITRATPAPVLGLTGVVKAIAAGADFTCALTTVGAVQCWGSNSRGQIGDGTAIDRVTPVKVSGLTSGVRAITAGDNFTCAAMAGGGVQCWGGNVTGQLGDGTTTSRSLPAPVIGLTAPVTALAGGAGHTCALAADGGVQCWGYNNWGQLGDGSTTTRSLPAPVAGLTSGVVDVVAGAYFTCAVTAGGGAECWGVNSTGQLGDSTTTTRSTPGAVVGLTSVVSALAAGANHVCALTIEGGAQCWGYNNGGQLGDGTTLTRLTPTPVIGMASGAVFLAGGNEHTCAVMANGEVKCWGSGACGQLGNGAMAFYPVPVQVVAMTSGAAAVAGGYLHTSALTTTGSVLSWGDNVFGQLGDGTLSPRSTPSAAVGLTSGVQSITAGGLHTCAVASGGARCWGSNAQGQLGDGTVGGIRETPGSVSGLGSGVTAVAAGQNHTCAVVDGGVRCWGTNAQGQVGDGTMGGIRVTPGVVIGLGSGVIALAAGSDHTCAIVGGGVWCWGANADGQVGDGSIGTTRPTPVAVIGLASGVTALAAGGNHTCALLDDGVVQCWGGNRAGQLGDGTMTTRAIPASVPGLIGKATAVTAGRDHTCALMTGGAVQCWGLNNDGELGDGTTTLRLLPVRVTALQSAIGSLDAGDTHTCAVTVASSVLCWGSDGVGQLGDGARLWLTPVPVVRFGQPPVVVTVTTTTLFPSPALTPVTFAATGTGAVAPLHYKFLVYSSGTSAWTLLQDYSPANEATWTPQTAGVYSLQVWVRYAGSTAKYDAWGAAGPFTVQTIGGPPPPVVSALTTPTVFPAPPGTSITWTATATGGVAPLNFKFWLYEYATATWVVLQDYAPASQVTWTPQKKGTYGLQVWVRSAGSTAPYEAWRSSDDVVIDDARPRVTALTAQPQLPVAVSTPVTWTATATGGPEPLEYRFYLYAEQVASWTMLQDYSSSNRVTWTPQTPGTYWIQVWVRGAGSIAKWDDWKSSDPFDVIAGLTVTTFTSNVSPPVTIGTPVTLTAAAAGGSGPVEFRFWLRDPAGAWTLLRDYGTSGEVIWTPPNAGTYSMQVWVRTVGSTPAWQAWKSLGPFDVVASLPTVTALTPAPLPLIAGLPMTWTATATGGVAPLEYQFWLCTLATGRWTLLRDYSTANQVAWTPPAVGDYLVQVWVRSAGSTLQYEAWRTSNAVSVQ